MIKKIYLYVWFFYKLYYCLETFLCNTFLTYYKYFCKHKTLGLLTEYKVILSIKCSLKISYVYKSWSSLSDVWVLASKNNIIN